MRGDDDDPARVRLWVDLVLALSGSYDEEGIRRWLHRTRAALHGRTPAEVLADGFDPDSDAAQTVLRLARELQ